MLEDSEAEDYLGESEQGLNEEDGQPTEEKLLSDVEREEELIPNAEFWGLAFKAMLKLALPSKRI